MPPDNLRPCQEKPKTTSSVARRMISSALGVKIAVSKDKLEEERKAMQRAKGTYSLDISVVRR